VRVARLVSNQSRAVLVLVALVCAAGVYAAWQLPIAIFPSTDFPRIVIIVDNGVAPAPETLVSVTRPIEEAMNGIPGIQRIKSKTSRGSSEVSLFFNWNVSIIQSLQLVQARLSQLATTLPPTARIEHVERLTFAVFPVTGYSLTSDTRDLAGLRDIATYTIRPRLARLPGIATVGSGVEPQYPLVSAYPGKPAVLLNINRQPDANTVAVVDEVKAELAAMRSQIPRDIKIAPYYDQSLLVRDSMNSVRDSILIGLLLSVVILFAFLRNWGTTFVAVLVIPVTVLATFLAMWLAGMSFDLMTLGGVAAAIGLVIDDAIVVVENIYTHRARGESRHDAVQRAVSEITIPIIGSNITPDGVFLPLTLLTGVTGVFFRSLALTMAVALVTSLMLALSVTPVLAQRVIPPK